MSKTKGRTVDGLTFPALRVAVEDITDWRWYAARDESDQLKLVRRLGHRIAEIRWDGNWWRWSILDEKQSVLMHGQGGRLTEALVAAEDAQPYQILPCPTWCQFDHSTDHIDDGTRYHSMGDEITVSEGRHTAIVGVSYFSSPNAESQGAPTVYVSGLDDQEMTADEAEMLRSVLAQAIERVRDAKSLYDHDGEQRRQSSIRQRTSPSMRAYAQPLVGEEADERQAA